MSAHVTNIIEPFNIPRQALPDIYFQTGDLEAVTRSCILSGSVTGTKAYPLVIDHDAMLDIDSKEDFKRAQNKDKLMLQDSLNY